MNKLIERINYIQALIDYIREPIGEIHKELSILINQEDITNSYITETPEYQNIKRFLELLCKESDISDASIIFNELKNTVLLYKTGMH